METDETDSDISIDENDDPISDQEEEETHRRKSRIVTKAYKVFFTKKKKIYIPLTYIYFAGFTFLLTLYAQISKKL